MGVDSIRRAKAPVLQFPSEKLNTRGRSGRSQPDTEKKLQENTKEGNFRRYESRKIFSDGAIFLQGNTKNRANWRGDEVPEQPSSVVKATSPELSVSGLITYRCFAPALSTPVPGKRRAPASPQVCFGGTLLSFGFVSREFGR